jgi:hypothetical protein
MLFDASVLGVAAYAVFWLDQSGWWFVFAMFLLICSGKWRED